MSGISTDVEEFPANSSAARGVSLRLPVFVALDLHSNMMAMAMSIISTWW